MISLMEATGELLIETQFSIRACGGPELRKIRTLYSG